MPHRTPPPRRRAGLVVAGTLALLALAACGGLGLFEETLEGQLLDPNGGPVANAVVFVPEGAQASALQPLQSATCQAPSEDAKASTCTDAQGRYALRVATPVLGSVTLVFERLYWRTQVTVDLGVRTPGEPVEVPTASFEALEPAAELEAAVAYALPSLARFELIALNDEKIVTALLDHAELTGGDVVPTSVILPILQPDVDLPEFIAWTAYHHDVREGSVQDCAIDGTTFEDVDCVTLNGPSLTFQGVPYLGPKEIAGFFNGTDQRDLSDEALFQVSTIAIVGNELDATYFGAQLDAPRTPSSLQGLRSVLDVHYDAVTVNRLLSENAANYLLHNQVDLVMPEQDEELHAEATSAPARIRPASHFLEDGEQVLRPVMVADSTVYDADTRTWLVPEFRARVDAIANRQNLFFAVTQLSATEAPASLTSLSQWSNAFSVRTRIAGYRRLTTTGQAKLAFPSSSCGGEGSLMDVYRTLSRDSTTVSNEYWMWWTNTEAYPGDWGCAYIGVLGETPRGYAVGWTSFRNYTLETVGQTFMHETGHILDAVHGGGVATQRCTLLGIFPFGVTGPSIMGGTGDRNLRTNCFALTPSNGTSLRNRTRVAEHLHLNLVQP